MGYWTAVELERLFPWCDRGRFVRSRVGPLWIVRRGGHQWGVHTFDVGGAAGLAPAQAAAVLNLVSAYPPKGAPLESPQAA